MFSFLPITQKQPVMLFVKHKVVTHIRFLCLTLTIAYPALSLGLFNQVKLVTLYTS